MTTRTPPRRTQLGVSSRSAAVRAIISDDVILDCRAADLSDAAFRAHIEALVWTVKHGTDATLLLGHVPSLVAPTAGRGLHELLESGFWTEVDGGYKVVAHVRGIVPTRRLELPTALRAKVLQRDGHACLACGTSEDLQIDHVVAVANGGPTSIGNLQTLCGPCNYRKGTQEIDYRRPYQSLKASPEMVSQ